MSNQSVARKERRPEGDVYLYCAMCVNMYVGGPYLMVQIWDGVELVE